MKAEPSREWVPCAYFSSPPKLRGGKRPERRKVGGVYFYGLPKAVTDLAGFSTAVAPAERFAEALLFESRYDAEAIALYRSTGSLASAMHAARAEATAS